MEKIQIVDKNQRVIGALDKAEAYRTQAIHQIARVQIISADGNYLLQRRSPLEDTYPGMWDQSSGGHVNAGETPLQTAVRELREELGITLDPTRFRLKSTYFTEGSYGDKVLRRFNYLFVVKVNGSLKLKLDSSEVSEVSFVSKGELAELIRSRKVTPGLVDVVNRLADE